ncbi:MAG: hypothetical protein AAF465_02440 [Pseudomonadota bacterium]
MNYGFFIAVAGVACGSASGSPPLNADTPFLGAEIDAVASALGGPSWVPLGEPSVGGRVTSISVSPHDANRVLIGGDMLGVGVSNDKGESWRSSFGFVSWEIGSFSWHPTQSERVWVGTMGGPYESRDGGVNWTLRRTGMPEQANFDFSAPIEKVLFDPNDSTRLLAVGGTSRRWRVENVDGLLGAVWLSTNEGQEWEQLTTITADGSSTAADAQGVNVVSMTFAAQSSSRLYASVDGRGVYRSLDGGATWQRLSTALPHDQVERVLAHPTLPLTVFVSLGNDTTQPGGMYVSTDGGDSFSPINNGLAQVSGTNSGNTSRYKGVAIDAVNGQRLIACDDRFGSLGIYQSEDGGASWGLVLPDAALPLPYPSGAEMEVATIAPSDPDLIFAAGSANLVRSTDGGQTWNDAANLYFDNGYYRGRGYSGLVATEVTFNPGIAGHLLIQGFDGARIVQSTDNGVSWRFEGNQLGSFSGGADAIFASASVAYASLGFQSNYQGVARTVDSGQTWQIIAGGDSGLPEIGASSKAGAIHASTSDTSHVHVIIDGDVYRSTDSGSTWAMVRADNGFGWFASLPDESQLFLSADDGVYISSDGVVFTSIGGPARPGKLSMTSDGTLWMAAHDRTGNAGLGVWTYRADTGWVGVLDPNNLTGEFGQAMRYVHGIAVSPADSQTVAIVTGDPPFRDVSRSSGVYLTRDGGLSWKRLNSNLPMLRGAAIAFDPHDPRRLVMGTAGRGFYQLQLETTPASAITRRP